MRVKVSSSCRRRRSPPESVAIGACWMSLSNRSFNSSGLVPPEAGRLMAADSVLQLDSAHLHANGRETTSHLEFAFKFFPKGYQPKYGRSSLRLGNGTDIDAHEAIAYLATMPEVGAVLVARLKDDATEVLDRVTQAAHSAPASLRFFLMR